jgi:hypothetical protein
VPLRPFVPQLQATEIVPKAPGSAHCRDPLFTSTQLQPLLCTYRGLIAALPAMTTVPQGPIEARSLSSVTAIASNPPAYPRNPTHEKHEPLSLYIVRVPGSKGMSILHSNLYSIFPAFSSLESSSLSSLKGR